MGSVLADIIILVEVTGFDLVWIRDDSIGCFWYRVYRCTVPVGGLIVTFGLAGYNLDPDTSVDTVRMYWE